MNDTAMNNTVIDDTTMNDTATNRPVRRAELIAWESAAWALVGITWVTAAWPGLIVDWDGAAYVPAVAAGVLALLAGWQILHGAPVFRPTSWMTSRSWTSNRHPPKPRRAVKKSVIIDGLLWAGSGVAWCAAARRFNWSETVTGALFQVGIGVALTLWAILGLVASTRIPDSANDETVVRRRILGAGPMTIRRGNKQRTMVRTPMRSSRSAILDNKYPSI